MGGFRNIFRLTRPVNLLIVLLTMAIIRYVVMADLMRSTNIGMDFRLSGFEFFLVVIIALAVTAAGNIINDYFDQKVDRINKPEMVIVGKSVKRRIAIVLHQGLNIFAVLCAAFLSFRTEYWWPLLMVVFIITLLWWYSPVFKKKPFIGNFVVALCTGSVPLWAGWYETHELSAYYGDMMIHPEVFTKTMWMHLFTISGFAFLLTLVREAVKDLEDLHGDTEGEYHTIPITFGVDNTRRYIQVLIVLFILAVAGVMWMTHSILQAIIVDALLIIPAIYIGVLIQRANEKTDYRICSRWLKGVILCGLAVVIWIYAGNTFPSTSFSL